MLANVPPNASRKHFINSRDTAVIVAFSSNTSYLDTYNAVFSINHPTVEGHNICAVIFKYLPS